MNSYVEQPEYLRSYEAEKARQGHIVLRTPLRLAIFMAGLLGFVLLAVFMNAGQDNAPISPLDRNVPTIEL